MTRGGGGLYKLAAIRYAHPRHLFAFAAPRQAVGVLSADPIRWSRYQEDASSVQHSGVG
jgi:hypothetical protein